MKVPEHIMVEFGRRAGAPSKRRPGADNPICLGPFGLLLDDTRRSFAVHLHRDPTVFSTVRMHIDGFSSRLAKARVKAADGWRPPIIGGYGLYAATHLANPVVTDIEIPALRHYLSTLWLYSFLRFEAGAFQLFNQPLPEAADLAHLLKRKHYAGEPFAFDAAYMCAHLLGLEPYDLPNTHQEIAVMLDEAKPRWLEMKDKLIEGFTSLQAGNIPMWFAPPVVARKETAPGAVEFMA